MRRARPAVLLALCLLLLADHGARRLREHPPLLHPVPRRTGVRRTGNRRGEAGPRLGHGRPARPPRPPLLRRLHQQPHLGLRPLGHLPLRLRLEGQRRQPRRKAADLHHRNRLLAGLPGRRRRSVRRTRSARHRPRRRRLRRRSAQLPHPEVHPLRGAHPHLRLQGQQERRRRSEERRRRRLPRSRTPRRRLPGRHRGHRPRAARGECLPRVSRGQPDRRHRLPLRRRTDRGLRTERRLQGRNRPAQAGLLDRHRQPRQPLPQLRRRPRRGSSKAQTERAQRRIHRPRLRLPQKPAGAAGDRRRGEPLRGQLFDQHRRTRDQGDRVRLHGQMPQLRLRRRRGQGGLRPRRRRHRRTEHHQRDRAEQRLRPRRRL